MMIRVGWTGRQVRKREREMERESTHRNGTPAFGEMDGWRDARSCLREKRACCNEAPGCLAMIAAVVLRVRECGQRMDERVTNVHHEGSAGRPDYLAGWDGDVILAVHCCTITKLAVGERAKRAGRMGDVLALFIFASA